MVGGTWPPYRPLLGTDHGADTVRLGGCDPGRRQCRLCRSAGGTTARYLRIPLSVLTSSPNKEAAYLFVQWMNSPTISLERVMLPYTLRDPFRLSHFSSEAYRALWGNAGEYLDMLQEQTDSALLDIIMPGSQDTTPRIDQIGARRRAERPRSRPLADANAAFNESPTASAAMPSVSVRELSKPRNVLSRQELHRKSVARGGPLSARRDPRREALREDQGFIAWRMVAEQGRQPTAGCAKRGSFATIRRVARVASRPARAPRHPGD